MKFHAIWAIAALGLAACGGEDAAETVESDLAEEVEPNATAAADSIETQTLEPVFDPAAALVDAEAYLADNAERSDVMVTASGLQYQILESGPVDGPNPAGSDWICAHYTGTLVDGTEFDSSRADGRNPLAYRADGFIDGWVEALSMMTPGDRRILYIHPDLGYGARGAGDVIPPNAALIFDMELIDILDPADVPLDALGRPDPAWDCSADL